MNVGFIGVGRMGSGIAASLIRNGHRLRVCDISATARERALRMGATVCDSPREAARGQDVVFLCLMLPDFLEEVVLGPDGVLSGAPVPPLLIDTSTMPPWVTRRVSEQARRSGCQMLDAALSGGPQAAADGTLSLMVGGPPDALEKALPLLRQISNEIFYMGGTGTGNTMKLVNNLMTQVTKACIAEALMLGTLAGIEPGKIFDAVSVSSGSSWMFQYVVPRILKGDFEPGGSTVSNHKALLLASQLGDQLGLPMPMVNTAKEVFQRAIAAGLGAKDGAAVITLNERLMGLEVRDRSEDSSRHDSESGALAGHKDASDAERCREIGFIGLGRIGTPMAANLIKGGHRLWAYDIAPEAIARARAIGAAPCGSPREASEGRDAIFLSLAHPGSLEEVVLGPSGVLSTDRVPRLLIDTSTMPPGVSRRIASAALERGCRMLEAPISGGIKGGGVPTALAGALTIMAGGSLDAFEEALPLLELIGKQIFHVGEIGAGNTLKLVNNLLGNATRASTAEAMMLGTLAGIDPGSMYKVVSASGGNSAAFQTMAPRVLKGDFEPGGVVASMHKGLCLACELGEELGLPMPMANAAKEVFQGVVAEGLGMKDGSAVIIPYERLMGVEVRERASALGPPPA